MTLVQALTSHFSPKSRARGAAYFASKAVTAFEFDGTTVAADVHGTDDYAVRLDADGDTVRGSCSCPYFVDRLDPCKHLWAVVLECDTRRVTLLDAAARREDIGFEAIDPDEERDDEPLETAADAAQRRGVSLRNQLPHLPSRARSAPPVWQQALEAITRPSVSEAQWQPRIPEQLLFVIDLAGSLQQQALLVHLMQQDRKKNGEWSVPKPLRLATAAIPSLAEPDRVLIERLQGARPSYAWAWGTAAYEVPSPFLLNGTLAADLLPAMVATGRTRLAMTEIATLRPQDAPVTPLIWDAGEPWTCELAVERDEALESYVVNGHLRRGDTFMPLAETRLLSDSGFVLTATIAARMTIAPALGWLHQIERHGRLVVPFTEGDRLRDVLLRTGIVTTDLPEELRVEVRTVAPRPRLSIRPVPHEPAWLSADLSADYDGIVVPVDALERLVRTHDPRVVLPRDIDAEVAARGRLETLGVRSARDIRDGRMVARVAARDLPALVSTLVGEGWHVEAEGRRYRLPTTAVALDVRSGIDWFEVHGQAAFDEQTVALPALLASLQRGDRGITLDDGTIGIVPEDWLKSFAPLALGAANGDHVRFRGSQVLLLDALLEARPAVSWDATFAHARDRLRSFDAIAPGDPPDSFTGTLRGYQREGLGWLTFLGELGFGGCLADDMGLGKTVMVLALLESRRRSVRADARPRPSLVVAPRSLMFNWRQEAERFTPALRVLDFSGAGRSTIRDQIAASDLVLTTYGTLRRDAERLVDQQFDYVILDEAQTIKNAGTVSAKAARLLRGAHRLALSGTPIENRLGDLWSLFEFLNPGLLSGASSFARAFASHDEGDERLRLLGRGLRPFILRRTKEQVAAELPPKTEQTIECELERPQRTLYNQLRDHYRRQLLDGRASWQRSKLQVLEALLRLRQAACHPGLIDRKRSAEPSAKLDLLVPRLIETIAEGHKTLVFSQFTSFLGLLRERLAEHGIVHEYLDGNTRDRAARIERFQQDPDCRLFLVSLKAGGLGLNLTAADYVFLLDPWWNPAAEAQAIDRSHRIGQTRSVFAYRLIARDTVEERVLDLQQRKRHLADAILTEDNSVVRNLSREDLELLLS